MRFYISLILLIGMIGLTGCINYSKGTPGSDKAILKLYNDSLRVDPSLTFDERLAYLREHYIQVAVNKIDGKNIVSLTVIHDENIAYLTPGRHVLSMDCQLPQQKSWNPTNREVTIYAKPGHVYKPVGIRKNNICEPIIQESAGLSSR